MVTHSSGLARSRLDRVYSNHHVAEQLDSRLGCACLDWVPQLSHHRPIVFFKLRSRRSPQSELIDEKVVKGPSWPHRVSLRYGALKEESPEEDPFTNLHLLKQAISDVSKHMSEESRRNTLFNQAKDIDDKIGWTMRALRAYERGHRADLLNCIKAYPKIGELVNPYNHLGRGCSGYRALQDWAVQIHKESLLEDLRSLQDDETDLREDAVKHRRGQIQVILNRLKPGRCNAVGAIQKADGEITGDPEAILVELRRYWSNVFSRRSCDSDVLRQWVQDEPNLPTWDSRPQNWIPAEEDMCKTIKASGRSAPGPDGIPYIAWRRLGNLATKVLHAAALDMAERDMQGHLDSISFWGERVVASSTKATWYFCLRRQRASTLSLVTITPWLMFAPS